MNNPTDLQLLIIFFTKERYYTSQNLFD